jgi:hypothetical protein
MPGEEDHHAVGGSPGGSEQFMHCVGELVLHGERYEVDCYAPRDRSWRQVRTEQQGGAVAMPPIGWSPMCFGGGDLIFNQVSIEAPDSEPAWKGIYDVPEDRPTHHFAWVYAGGEVREITRVRRSVLAYHPVLHMALKQEIEAQDAGGTIYRFVGEAIAASPIPAWPNAAFFDSVFRWEDEQGRVAHSTYQEIWFDKYQRAMHERARETAHA